MQAIPAMVGCPYGLDVSLPAYPGQRESHPDNKYAGRAVRPQNGEIMALRRVAAAPLLRVERLCLDGSGAALPQSPYHLEREFYLSPVGPAAVQEYERQEQEQRRCRYPGARRRMA